MAEESALDPAFPELIHRFVSCPGYDRSLSLELVATGKTAGADWDLRCLAALMLEAQFLRIPATCILEQRLILQAAGCPDDEPFVRSLRRRLQRHTPVHRQMRRPTGGWTIADWLHLARQPCRLWFTRCFFRPEEIARRILAELRISGGMGESLPDEPGWLEQARRSVGDLPDCERRIAEALSGKNRIYWVTSKTPSHINSLLEYPPGTVALVVKPPGSDLEFEIKRAGIRGPNVLSVIFARGDTKVPWPHRLQGGSAGCMIEREARATHRIDRLYRAIHGEPAPIGKVLDIHSVYTVPGASGDADLLSYFTEPAAFGDGFRGMRRATAHCVADFEKGKPEMDLPGELGLTIRFLTHLAPKQAILSGTSSFRLDRLARYLSPEGPELYFRGGLQRDYSAADKRRLADDLLIEALGIYQPPAGTCADHPAYIAAALAIPANRRRADRTYLDLMRQIGRFWGTLAAAGGNSRGEAFIARNTGLRSCWIGERWKVRICFLDHDNTWVPWKDCGELDPHAMLEGIEHDARYIFHDRFSIASAPGEIGCLRQIYQPSPHVVAEGREALFAAARAAAWITRTALAKSESICTLIDPAYLSAKANWDHLVRSWLREDRSTEGVSPDWEGRARRQLAAKGFDESKAARWLGALQHHCEFLAKFGCLYDSGYSDFSRSKKQPGG